MNENEKGYTDWLYNRYVDAVRMNDHMRATIYLDLLEKCIGMFNSRKFSRLRRLARELLKEIYRAQRSGTLAKLLLRGEEGAREFERKMFDYEQQLRDLHFSEDKIKEMVIDKRINYGQEV